MESVVLLSAESTTHQRWLSIPQVDRSTESELESQKMRQTNPRNAGIRPPPGWPSLPADIPGGISSFPPQVVLFHQGDLVSLVYLLEAGAIKLSQPAEDRDVLIAVCGPGRLIGVGDALLGAPYCATATTLGRCSLRTIPTASLLARARVDEDCAGWIPSVLQSGQHAVRVLVFVELSDYMIGQQ